MAYFELFHTAMSETMMGRILNLGMHQGLRRYEAQRVRSLNVLAVVAFVSGIMAIPGLMHDGRPEGYPINALFQLVMVLILWLQSKRQYGSAATTFVLASWAAVTLQTLVVGPETGIHLWSIPIIVLPAVILPAESNRLYLGTSLLALSTYIICGLWLESIRPFGAVYLFAQILSGVVLLVMLTIMRRATIRAESESMQHENRLSDTADALRETNDRMEKASRHKDEFLATISHELRTPLHAIMGINEVLIAGVYGDLEPQQLTALNQVASSGDRLLSLIEDVLDVSKIAAGRLVLERSEINLKSACMSAVTLLTPLADQKGLSILFTQEAEVCPVSADPKRLHQILVNLVGNAIKFTDVGTIELKVSMASEECVQIDVRDSGIGIAAKNLELLFQPFMQVDGRLSRSYEGTGLGLALVKSLVDAHGGSVEVDSTVGVGSCFSIALPALHESAI
jgi:signal transduction histidine kinase